MGAYGLAVAAAFAVALAVLVSSSTPVEAVAGESAADPADPGSTVTISAQTHDDRDDLLEPTEAVGDADALVTFTIIGNGSVTGSTFAAGGGTTLLCDQDASCDAITAENAGVADDDTTALTSNGAQVKVNVGTTSGTAGEFYVRIEAVGATAQIVTVHVAKGAVATKVTVKPVDKSIPASHDGDGTSLTITVTDASNKGIAGHKVRIYTTNGLFVDDNGATGVTGVTGRTAERLPGVGALNTGVVSEESYSTSTTTGLSTITALTGESAETGCTNRGGCDLITRAALDLKVDHDGDGVDTEADPAQSAAVSVSAKAGTAVVMLKGSGRPGVATITAVAANGVTGTTTVTLSGDARQISAATDQESVQAAGDVYAVVTIRDSGDNPVSGQKVSKITVKAPTANAVSISADGADRPKGTHGSKAAIPSCTGDDGTNGDGQCALKITAGTATAPATRGAHTITFEGPGSIASADRKVTVTMTVAGKPASVTHDAPARVDTLETTKITVTAVDDAGVRVGAVTSRIEQIEGGGTILNDEDGTADTGNGQRSFSYFSPSNSGVATFFVSVGSGADAVKDTITIQIGEAMPETPEEPDPPAMPEGDATLSVQGPLGSFSGGSIAEFAAAVEAACPGGATIYVAVSLDDWGTPYVSDATIPLVNATFAARFPSGLAAGTLVAVTRCEADAMEDEG